MSVGKCFLLLLCFSGIPMRAFQSQPFFQFTRPVIGYDKDEKVYPRFDDDIVLDLNDDVPFRIINVTVGQRLVVVCRTSDPRSVQRVYYSTRDDAYYMCDTFLRDTQVAASCVSGQRHHEMVLNICEESMKCELKLKKGGTGFVYSDSMSGTAFGLMRKVGVRNPVQAIRFDGGRWYIRKRGTRISPGRELVPQLMRKVDNTQFRSGN